VTRCILCCVLHHSWEMAVRPDTAKRTTGNIPAWMASRTDSSALVTNVDFTLLRAVCNYEFLATIYYTHTVTYFSIFSLFRPSCRARTPLFPPCPFTSSSFPLLLFSFFFRFTYFLLLSIPSLSIRIVPLRFQAGGRRK